MEGLDLQQWAAAREAYLTLGLLCQHAGRCPAHEAMLSREAAGSLARQAQGWLAGLPLRQLLAACCTVAAKHGGQQEQQAQPSGGSEAATAGGTPARPHYPAPFPALTLPRYPAAPHAAAAYAVLSTLSAALHFLGTYWEAAGVQQGPEERREAQQVLASAGLLAVPPAPEAGSHGGVAGLEQLAGEAAGFCWGSVTQLVEYSLQCLQPAQLSSSVTTAPSAAAAANLAVALARLDAVLQPRSSSGAAPPAPTTAASAVLGPLLSQRAAAALLTACSPAAGFDSTLLHPWDCARWQPTAQLARAAAAALAIGTGTSGGEAAAADVAAAVLCTLPPGDDSAALLALTELVSARGAVGTGGLAAVAGVLDRLQASPSVALAGGAVADHGKVPALCVSLSCQTARHGCQFLLVCHFFLLALALALSIAAGCCTGALGCCVTLCRSFSPCASGKRLHETCPPLIYLCCRGANLLAPSAAPSRRAVAPAAGGVRCRVARLGEGARCQE